MPDPQIPLRELLADPTYRKWFAKVPTLRNYTPGGRPFRVYVQEDLDGRWKRVDLESYARAYKYIAKHLKDFHDAALTIPSQVSSPPILVSKEMVQRVFSVQIKGGKTKNVRRWVYERSYWRPQLELLGHQWCSYCRRPTVFAYFARHHALPSNLCTQYNLRCSICGVRRTFIRDYWATAPAPKRAK